MNRGLNYCHATLSSVDTVGQTVEPLSPSDFAGGSFSMGEARILETSVLAKSAAQSVRGEQSDDEEREDDIKVSADDISPATSSDLSHKCHSSVLALLSRHPAGHSQQGRHQ